MSGMTIPRIITDRIGPMEHNATRPKESLLEFLSLRTAARPMPKAMIKGTVMGPVVTPPESKAAGTKLSGTKNESAKTTR